MHRARAELCLNNQPTAAAAPVNFDLCFLSGARARADSVADRDEYCGRAKGKRIPAIIFRSNGTRDLYVIARTAGCVMNLTPRRVTAIAIKCTELKFPYLRAR